MHNNPSHQSLQITTYSLDIAEILLDGYIMDPGLHGRVEELEPIFAHVEHQGVTQEQVLQAETGRHTTEVEQVPGKERWMVKLGQTK